MKTRMVISCAAYVLLVALVLSFDQPAFAQAASGQSDEERFNTVSLHLTSAELDPLEGYNVIRAFVPTGSASVNCQASLNEIFTNASPAGITMFCAKRQPSAFGGSPGILISIFFLQSPPPDLTVDVTLYQKGARTYGAPVLCTSLDGC